MKNFSRPIILTPNKYPFPQKPHIYYKIFNRNKPKVSYSCMKNIKMIINNHNISIFLQNKKIEYGCNYKNRKYCPLGGRCFWPNIIYGGKITPQPKYREKV